MKSVQTLLLTISFLLTITANAQIVNIPDPNFKVALLFSMCVDNDGDSVAEADVDTNNDGEIQLSEALAVKGLKVVNKQIDSLNGVEQFTNLEVLDFGNNKVKSVDIQTLTNLKKISSVFNQLTALDLQAQTQLQYLYCNNCQLGSLNVQGLSNLQEIWASFNKLTSINLTGLTSLHTLRCTSNLLPAIELQGLTSLQFLDCSKNLLTSLNVQGLPSLKYLLCNYNQLTELNVQGVNNLWTLNCSTNPITTLDLRNLPILNEVDCVYCQLTDLKVGASPNLQYLDLNDNLLTSLDVSALYNLKEFDCTNNKLVYLYIKNGSAEIFGLYFGGNPDLHYICCDENQIAAVASKVSQSGLTNCAVGDYCTFDPGGVFYNLIGQNKVDINNNGCDNDDYIYPYLKFNISTATGNGTIIGRFDGSHRIPLQDGMSTIQPLTENPDYYTAQPAVMQFVLPADTNLMAQNICIVPNQVHHDVEITLLPIRRARPGFDATYRIVVQNKGNQVENGTIRLYFDDDRVGFLSADVTPDEISNGTLVWHFSNMFLFESRNIHIVFNINSPSETPAVNVGDLLSYDCAVEIMESDDIPTNNFFGIRQIVVGSFDPNDKTCLEGDTISSDLIGKYLHYLIRFENTGTYAAENIVVKDVIDLSKFDISTLQIISSSHDCYARIRNNNQVEFIFENINLPFTEPDKHGFIAFKIKSKPNLTVGSTLSNQADIFFDYNLPITTNKAITLIHNTVGTYRPASNVFSLQIQPNPAKDVLYLNAEMPLERVEIFDALGRSALKTPVENGRINIAHLGSGTYFLKAYGRNSVVEGRMVKE